MTSILPIIIKTSKNIVIVIATLLGNEELIHSKKRRHVLMKTANLSRATKSIVDLLDCVAINLYIPSK